MKKLEEQGSVLTVDLGEVHRLAETGGKLVFDPRAEAAIVTLLEMQEAIELALTKVKEAIAESGKQYNPNFTSVQGDRVKAGYRYYGGKYGIDSSLVDTLSPEFYNAHVSYKPNTKAIDKFAEEKGALPLGINKAERSKQLTLKRLDLFDEGDGYGFED